MADPIWSQLQKIDPNQVKKIWPGPITRKLWLSVTWFSMINVNEWIWDHSDQVSAQQPIQTEVIILQRSLIWANPRVKDFAQTEPIQKNHLWWMPIFSLQLKKIFLLGSAKHHWFFIAHLISVVLLPMLINRLAYLKIPSNYFSLFLYLRLCRIIRP